MRREDILELEGLAIEHDALPVERTPLYFDQSRARGGEGPIFGWYHATSAEIQTDCVAVICGPIGYEYTRSHRSIRHLADRLAERGVPAVRFDYHGLGDSPGHEVEGDRVTYWQSSVRAAIRQAKALSGRKRVCLIGVRLGASMAAMVASEMPVDLLVLWNPCIKGRTYVRELQAIAMSAARTAADCDGGLESAGFTMSAQTLDALRAVDLMNTTYGVTQRALLVGRDDLSADRSLCDHLIAGGIACDYERSPGWLGMVADHQFTVVPDEALETISDWVALHAEPRMPVPPRSGGLSRETNTVSVPLESAETVMIEERACQFGEAGHLFGILSRNGPATDRPALILLNAGAIHHVGPNRLYVTLARQLSARGMPCFRIDLEGLGDSVLRCEGRENHPYPHTAVDDVRAAVEYMKQLGYTRFITLGLCSGAHTAFHAALQLDEPAIEELILVNPWVFYWKEGMSLDTTQHFEDVAAYRKSMKDPSRWMKLLRGQVDVMRIAKVGAAHVKATLQSRAKALIEALGLGRDTPLSRDLKKLIAGRRIAIFVADGDPGRDILMHDAKRTATRALKSGRLRLNVIPGADHTFSQSTPRRDLVRRVVKHLTYSTGPTSIPS
jgi:alpha-beta hydrolase superfamily lysophospholipase